MTHIAVKTLPPKNENEWMYSVVISGWEKRIETRIILERGFYDHFSERKVLPEEFVKTSIAIMQELKLMSPIKTVINLVEVGTGNDHFIRELQKKIR